MYCEIHYISQISSLIYILFQFLLFSIDIFMPIIYPNYMKPEEYFKNIPDIGKKYEAMKAFFVEKMTAEEVASMYGYTV